MSDHELFLIEEALVHAEAGCRYHGTDFERLGMEFGLPRCGSCKQPWRVAQARLALHAIWEALTRSPVGSSEVTDGR